MRAISIRSTRVVANASTHLAARRFTMIIKAFISVDGSGGEVPHWPPRRRFVVRPRRPRARCPLRRQSVARTPPRRRNPGRACVRPAVARRPQPHGLLPVKGRPGTAHPARDRPASRQSRERRRREDPGETEPVRAPHRRQQVGQPHAGSREPRPGRHKGLRHQPARPRDAQQVISTYSRLLNVEKSFRMSKSDLAARPVYHHKRESIEAHLTVVFAALALSRWMENTTGWPIRKFVRTARRYRSITIQAGEHTITAADPLPDDLRTALAAVHGTH
ncbi:hypothetical protein Franean1_2648 [Parafrankia sp. EAN1pec]|nr:hypothetical protein Franean1_2648 [Frankia sp. EAN1pec]